MATSQPAGTSQQPSYIGSYQVTRLLGEGAFGEVFQAYQAFLDRQVAIKLLHADLLSQESVQQHFMNEARTIARLRHPNIVSVYEFGIMPSDGRQLTYMVMEYLPGETLNTRLARARLAMPEVVRIAEQLAQGLDYAHAHNVIHRDLKPANILFSEQNEPVIVDFGLAKLMELSRAAETPSSSTASVPSEQTTSTGTPAYMSPEQVKGNATSPRSDQYTLGLIIYEMLTGTKAFDNPDITKQITKRLDGPPLLASTVIPDVPAAANFVFMRALAVDPADRYPSVGEFVRELGDALMPDRRHTPVTVVSDPVQAALLRASRQTILFGLWGVVALTMLVALYCISLFLHSYATGAPAFVWDGLILSKAAPQQFIVTGFWPGSVALAAGVKSGDVINVDLPSDYGDVTRDYKVNGQPRSALPPSWQPSVGNTIELNVLRDGQTLPISYTLDRSNFKLVILAAALVPTLFSVLGIVWLLLHWGAEPGLQLFVPITLAGNMALLGVALIDVANGLVALSLFVILPAFIHFILAFPEPIRYLERHPRRIWWLYAPLVLALAEFLLGTSLTIGGFQADIILYLIYGIIATVAIIWKWGRRDLRRYPGLWGLIAIIIASNVASIGATVIFGLNAATVFSVFGNGLNRWIAAYGTIFVGILIGVICSTVGYHFVQRQLGPSLVTQVSKELDRKTLV